MLRSALPFAFVLAACGFDLPDLPAVTDVSPPSLADDVAPDAEIRIAFRAEIDTSAIAADAIQILRAGIPVEGDLSFQTRFDDTTLRMVTVATFKPREYLRSRRTYSILVEDSIPGADGQSVGFGRYSEFSVRSPAWRSSPRLMTTSRASALALGVGPGSAMLVARVEDRLAAHVHLAGAWTGPLALSSAASSSGVVMPTRDGGATVAWLEAAPGGSQITLWNFATRTGITRTAIGPPGPHAMIAIAPRGTGYRAAWAQTDGEAMSVWSSTSPGAPLWTGAAVELLRAAGACTVWTSRTRVDGQERHELWASLADEPPTRLDDGPTAVRDVRIAVDDVSGRVVVAWGRAASPPVETRSQLYLRQWTTGSGWSQARQLTASSTWRAPRVAFGAPADGAAFVVWRDDADGHRTRMSRLTPVGDLVDDTEATVVLGLQDLEDGTVLARNEAGGLLLAGHDGAGQVLLLRRVDGVWDPEQRLESITDTAEFGAWIGADGLATVATVEPRDSGTSVAVSTYW